MSESTRKKIIAAILLVALIWGYNNLFSNSKKPVKNNKTTTSIQAQQLTTTAPAKPKLVNVEQKTKEPWGGDPFRLETGNTSQRHSPVTVLKWKLSGIFYNSASPVAIINRKRVKAGDTVSEAKVISIDREAVTLEHNGTRMTLTVTKG